MVQKLVKEGQTKDPVKKQILSASKIVNKKKRPSDSVDSNPSEKASENQSEFLVEEKQKNVQQVPKSQRFTSHKSRQVEVDLQH